MTALLIALVAVLAVALVALAAVLFTERVRRPARRTSPGPAGSCSRSSAEPCPRAP